MRTGARLLTAASVVLAASTWHAATRAQEVAASSPQISAPRAITFASPAEGEYVGSEACERCHQEAYARWKASLHIQMTRPVAAARILGDFSGRVKLSAHGRNYTFAMRDGKPTVTLRAGDRAPETYSADYTLGSKRFQGYLSTLPDGRIYVLPVFWEVASGRWLDWKETTPIPDGAHDMKQIWNVTCFNCHATNLDRGFSQAARAYETQWTELGIGCEACHGPGRAHITLADEWTRDPSLIPQYSSRASNHQLGATLKIFSPRTAEPRQTFDTCAYCHGNKRNVFTSFKAGDRYEDHAIPFLVSEPLPEFDFQGEFWPDGRPNRFNRPQALMQSGCFRAGAIACTSCHLAHGSAKNDFSLKVDVHDGRSGDRLCTQCHAGGGERITSRAADSLESRVPWTDAALTAHSFHKADSEGSRCVNCHMSDVNWRLLMRRRDHTFQAPVPESTAAFGIPNACTTCHDDKSPEWAARQMTAWWGAADAERRQRSVATATTLYGAGAGDRSLLPALARLAVDRGQNPVVRASALEYIGKLAGTGAAEAAAVESQTSTDRRRAAPPAGSPTAAAAFALPAAPLDPRVLGAMFGAAADPEPVVRASAAHALGAIGQHDERVLAVLMARLVDDARVVRVRAAEALLTLGVFTADGRAGAALARAQDEMAQSLRSFPESPTQQTSLAWLLAQQGDNQAADAAAAAAIALDPAFARPHVIRGVLAARAGRFTDAIASWKTARQLDPATPNIDKLIDEATRRAAAPPPR